MPQLVLWPPRWNRDTLTGRAASILYLVAVVVPVTVISVVIVLLLKPYEYFQRRRGPRMTAWQVANVLDRTAAGQISDDEWDEFSCVPIGDKRIDAIASQAVRLVESNDRPDTFRAELQQLARQLRNEEV